MIDQETARQIAIQSLHTIYIDGHDIVILDGATEERPYGWIFYYQSKQYLETREFVNMMFVGPIVVEKQTGAPHSLGSSLPSCLEEFEATKIDPRFWDPDRIQEYTIIQFLAAVVNNDIKKVHSFLNQGMSVDTTGWEGWTALYLAACRGHLRMVRFLLNKGADVNFKVLGGGTALLGAIVMGNGRIARMLVNYGANTNASDAEGDTPLMGAAKSSQRWSVPLTRFLLDRGADINAKDNEGRTALWRAVRFAEMDMIKLLLERGADVNARSNDGKSVLEYAEDTEDWELVELLKKAGAKA